MDIPYQKLLLCHNSEEESITNIDSIIKTVPTVLDTENPDVIRVGEFYLPYNTGFEIECSKDEDFNIDDFNSIPDIVHVQVDNFEQRYQIPAGIKGLQCLYNISFALKKNSLLNPLSGIHYHVDFKDYYEYIKNNNKEFFKFQDYILQELDTWNYPGKYNSKGVSFGTHTWLRVSHHHTLEIRIGEMTFDYELLFKRITHCNAIVRYIKNELYLEKTKKENPIFLYQDDSEIDGILTSRTKKI